MKSLIRYIKKLVRAICLFLAAPFSYFLLFILPFSEGRSFGEVGWLLGVTIVVSLIAGIIMVPLIDFLERSYQLSAKDNAESETSEK
ncbi:MAG: hypothetical protein V2I43_13660 [Parvularcula sp.]|nr:hypothetical protein [Parvularcula sp.]